MNKKVKIVLIVVAVALAVAVLVPVVGIGVGIVKDRIRYSKPANLYADTWNIVFPESAKESYSLSTGGRDSWSYSVYTVASGDDAAFADYSAEPMKEIMVENMREILDRVQVPQEQRPDLTKAYKWMHIGKNEVPSSIAEKVGEKYRYMDNLYVLYDAQTDTVYTFIRHT